MNKIHYSSKSDSWETPKFLFDKLNQEFNFNLDAAASKENYLCDNYFTKEDDALTQDWAKYGSVYLNPIYGRGIGKFIEKAYNESRKGCIIVVLVPSRTDTKWFANYIMKAKEIRFIKGRLKFINRLLPSWREDGDFKISPAPFPSMLVIFDGKDYDAPKISSWKQ